MPSPPMVSPTGSCATRLRTSVRASCWSPMSPKIDILGAQNEVIYIDFSVERLAGLGFNPQHLDRGPTGAEHRPARRGAAYRSGNHRAARFGRLHLRAGHRRRHFLDRGSHVAAQRYRRGSGEPLAIRPNRCFESMANRRSGWRSPCATAAIPWRSGGTWRERSRTYGGLARGHRTPAGSGSAL